ncbi:hypothetical protein EBT16_03485 [bacterium]|nr:hypothetical protein [bacterium]
MMEPTSSPLTGALGYALIGEIVGVTTLSWLCIGMFLRRLRQESVELVEAAPVEKLFKVEDSPEYLALIEKINQLESDKKKMDEDKAANPDVEQMRKTIAYLENKLLEYEIVQEEISTLGELKVENEKLKRDLNQLQRTQQPQAPAEELIQKQFSEFAEPAVEPKKEALPEDLQNLLSDIESLSKEKQTKA